MLLVFAKGMLHNGYGMLHRSHLPIFVNWCQMTLILLKRKQI